MAKNLDSIKKLSPEEVKKYRQVVLNYIGEKDKSESKETSNVKQDPPALRKVDSIKLNKIEDSKIKIGPTAEEKADLEKSRRQAERDRLKEGVLKQEEERKKIKQEEKLHKLKQEQAEKEQRLAEQTRINSEKEKARQAKINEEEKIKKQREQEKKERQEKEELIRQEKLKQKEEERLKKDQAEKELKVQKEKIKQAELKKKEIALKAKREAEAKAKAEEAERWQEKIRLEEAAREEKRRLKENLRLEKIKRREERKRIRQEIRLAKKRAAAKRKIKRQKAVKIFKKKAFRKLRKILFAVKQNFIFGASLLAMFLAVSYLIFCLAVLRFNLDNDFIKKMAGFLPVPAAVSSQGIISYQDFLKLADANYLSKNYQEKRDYLAEWLVLKNLKVKYGLSDQALIETVAEKFLTDQNFNQIGLSRIKKISELLSADEMEKLNKYADEYNDGIYLSAQAAAEKFAQAAASLAIGQTSGIIYHNGYYLVKRIDDKNSWLGFKYLFVGANTLEQYLRDKSTRIKVFILAN